ncbi:flavin reductase family protein [Fodinicola acaciae]|uniref:flavin reductase family protein n=1 Tax=Fodinicola acaciae TaxID=2681555 RepID=UPI0013D757B4|nr:flavin reductase family protein [Fodinicola acaciae]
MTRDTPQFSAGDFRACLGRFVTGVVVVTFVGDGPRGITVNSFTSVSMDPPLVLVSIAKQARSHDALCGAEFCVNVLGAEQERVARHFSGRSQPIEPVWSDGVAAPRLAGALACLECRPWRCYDGGDHTLVVGEVVDVAYRDGEALAYANSRFTSVAEPETGMEFLI